MLMQTLLSMLLTKINFIHKNFHLYAIAHKDVLIYSFPVVMTIDLLSEKPLKALKTLLFPVENDLTAKHNKNLFCNFVVQFSGIFLITIQLCF